MKIDCITLRDATRQAHLRVERHPLLTPLLSPDLDLEAYTWVLQAFYGYYLAIEPGLEDQLASGPMGQLLPYDYVSRAKLLADDLQDLGEGRSFPVVHPGAPFFPARLTSEHTLGWLYVLEGATQGGRIIAPGVSRALGFNETFGARYFHLYRRNQWQLFQALLLNHEVSYSLPRVIEGALDAFTNLTVHLDFWNTADKGPAHA